jgi:beta-N-acetylhexosaminidase
MKKTRIAAFLLTIPMILTGCGSAAMKAEPEETTVAVTEATTEPTTEPTTEAPTEPTTEPPVELEIDMTLEEKIYQLFIVTPEALVKTKGVQYAGDATRTALAARHVGGLVYFDGNMRSFGQTKDLIHNTQDIAMEEGGIGVFLAVDEEGGSVARCGKKIGAAPLDTMESYGSRNDHNEAFEVGQTLGRVLHQIGFNLDFAPVADVNLNPNNELGDRIFSTSPDVVSNMVDGVVTGIQEQGNVAATLKHFPGMGAAGGDTHEDGKVVINRSLDQLRGAEFVPFQQGIKAGADFVMVSHVTISGVGDDLPSCLSPVVCTDLLRNELGFEGIIVTDSMQMQSITANYDSGEAAVKALEAGCDMILMPVDLDAAVAAVQEAVENGTLSERRIDRSVKRILDEKKKLGILQRKEVPTESTEPSDN